MNDSMNNVNKKTYMLPGDERIVAGDAKVCA